MHALAEMTLKTSELCIWSSVALERVNICQWRRDVRSYKFRTCHKRVQSLTCSTLSGPLGFARVESSLTLFFFSFFFFLFFSPFVFFSSFFSFFLSFSLFFSHFFHFFPFLIEYRAFKYPYTTSTEHEPKQQRTARAGALMAHHPAWVSHHTGGSWSTPTVQRCRYDGRLWVAQHRFTTHDSDRQ